MTAQISVIIPNNNTLPLLRRMIDSIPDTPDVEVIVIDNSPTPLSAADITAGRSNVQAHYSDPALGAGGARNEGLRHASGQWLLFADADDFFTPNAFGTLRQDLASDCDIIYYGWTSCYSDTLAPASRNTLYDHYISLCMAGDHTKVRYYWDSPCGKLVRANLVRDHAVQFELCPAGNDMGFSVRVGTFARSVKAVATPVYCATILEGSITRTPSPRNIESRFKAIVRLNHFLKSQGLRRYRHSILNVWLSAWHCSPALALRLLLHSIRQGNSPLIGCSRWLSTARGKL